MKQVQLYYMENGRKEYYFGEYEEREARSIVKTAAKRKEYIFIERVKGKDNQ